MRRLLPAPLVHVIARLTMSLGAIVGSGCADAGPARCNTALDCGVREACRDGICVDEEGEGEGEGEAVGEGEGEGEGDERAIVTAACSQLIACGLASPPLETCVSDNLAGLASLRERGTAECTDSADALVATMSCAADEPCEVIQDTNDGGLFAQVCPAFVEFRALLTQCEGGEGEGEGEPPPEPPPDGCPGQAAFAPAQTTDTIIASVSNSDETAAQICGGTEQAVRLLLNVSGNLEAITGGFSSIDGITATDLLGIVVDPPAREVSATACLDQNFVEGFIAVALIVDGLLTSSACGFVQGF